MGELILALIVFFASHAGPAMPRVRPRLICRLGRAGYLAIYSAVSVATTAWLLAALITAPVVPLWPPAPWQHAVAAGAMLLACIALAAALLVPNPLSVGRPAPPDRIAPLLAVTRHPLLLALGLWAAAHALANGDLAAQLVFVPLALFSFAFMAVIDRRRRRDWGEAAWRARSASTSLLPFAALVSGRAAAPGFPQTVAVGATGLALFAALAALHGRIIGMDPFWLWP